MVMSNVLFLSCIQEIVNKKKLPPKRQLSMAALVHLREGTFVSTAGRTYPIFRKISKFRASSDTVVSVAFSFIINVAADCAFVLIHNLSLLIDVLINNTY